MRAALLLTMTLGLGLCACGGDSLLPATGGSNPAPVGSGPTDAPLVLKSPRPVADAAVPEAPRSTFNPLCATDYLGTTGQLQAAPDPGLPIPTALTGGAPASAAIAATLPQTVWLRDARESFTDTHYFAVREGNLYVKANRELTGIDEPWRALLVPECLAGQVKELSVDGTVILALDGGRWIYTLDTANYGPMTGGWTRRWGAFFWTDPGEQMPADAHQWATSHYSGAKTYIDRADREHAIFGILTVYLLRGDGLRITYMDPWLPSDESREVCGPERGTRVMKGLSGSGSSVIVITDGGEVYTRLYEFDVSGANSMFFDYSWQDQEGVAAPLMQLPAPDWVRQPRIPGRVTDRISLRQVAPDTRHRILRVEGLDAQGRSGFWEKDLPDAGWRFVATGEPLRGTLIAAGSGSGYVPEDFAYAGEIAGYRAEVPDFNPYCSPATLRLHVGDGAPTELVLHSTDGLRQERRARGLDAQPHVYRSAVEVPKALWAARDRQPAAVKAFLAANFPQRFLTGPLSATPDALQITMPCWTLRREASVGLPPMTMPDAGIYVAELRSAQEEGRAPGVCAPP